MLEDPGSISWETLQSQDGLNLGDIRFCPIRQTLRMQHISLDHLQKIIAEGAFMLPPIGGHSRAQQDYCHPPGLPGRWPA